MRAKLRDLVLNLERRAKQNESDARTSAWIKYSMDAAQANAVAAEQRRVIRILRDVLRSGEDA